MWVLVYGKSLWKKSNFFLTYWDLRSWSKTSPKLDRNRCSGIDEIEVLVHLGRVIKLNTGKRSSPRMVDNLLHKLVGTVWDLRGIPNPLLILSPWTPHNSHWEGRKSIKKYAVCWDLWEGKLYVKGKKLCPDPCLSPLWRREVST